MKKRKLFSRLLCLGFLWGIVSWILTYNYFIKDVFSLYTIPVFLSMNIQNNLLTHHIPQEMQMLSFLLSILIGGMIGYLIAFITSIAFKDRYKEDTRC